MSSRTLGSWTTGALVVGHTIGVGIFLTPAAVIGTLGDPRLVLMVWVGISLLVMAGALAFGSLGARLPQAGGLYVYLRAGWGERLAWTYGWQCLLVMDPGVLAALATGVQPYIVAIWPGLAGSERWLALAVIWIVVVATLAGLRISAPAMVALTAIKLAALAAIIVVAFGDSGGQWSHFAAVADGAASTTALAPALAVAAVSVFFSFGGFWDASRIADRIRDPGRTLPLAMTYGVGCVALVYVLTTAAFIYVLPPTEARSASLLAERIGPRLFGAAGGPGFAAVVIVSVLTSALGLAIFAPRLYIAMAADGVIPRAVVGRQEANGTPVRGLLVLATLASALAWTSGFTGILTYFMAPTLVFVALAALSAARRPVAPSSDRVSGGPLTAIAAAGFAVLLAAVILLVAVNQPLQAGAGFAVMAVGALAVHKGVMSHGSDVSSGR